MNATLNSALNSANNTNTVQRGSRHRTFLLQVASSRGDDRNDDDDDDEYLVLPHHLLIPCAWSSMSADVWWGKGRKCEISTADESMARAVFSVPLTFLVRSAVGGFGQDVQNDRPVQPLIHRCRCVVFAWCASEQVLASEAAVLMFYDNASRKWNDTGQTTLQICQNVSDNTFRIVGSKHNGQVSVGLENARLQKAE